LAAICNCMFRLRVRSPTPRSPLPWVVREPHLTLLCRSLDHTGVPAKMASKSVEWFKQDARMCQTDRQTDRQTTLRSTVMNRARAIPPNDKATSYGAVTWRRHSIQGRLTPKRQANEFCSCRLVTSAEDKRSCFTSVCSSFWQSLFANVGPN